MAIAETTISRFVLMFLLAEARPILKWRLSPPSAPETLCPERSRNVPRPWDWALVARPVRTDGMRLDAGRLSRLPATLAIAGPLSGSSGGP